MRTLANAIVDLAAFLELSGDDVVDPDAAVNALESLASALKSATPEEVAAIAAAVREQVASSPSPERAEFLRSFAENVGLPQSGASRHEHHMERRTDSRDVNGTRFPFLGLLACAFALIPMFAVLAAKFLYAIGGRYRDAGKSIGGIAVGSGFALDVLAVLAAVLAIVSAGPNRRIGFVALALVALSLFLL